MPIRRSSRKSRSTRRRSSRRSGGSKLRRRTSRKTTRKTHKSRKTRKTRKSRKSRKTYRTMKHIPKGKRCSELLQAKIAINLKEYKLGKYVSPQQAIAVAYSQLGKMYPSCKQVFTKKRMARNN